MNIIYGTGFWLDWMGGGANPTRRWLEGWRWVLLMVLDLLDHPS
ncbi:hypothetical protein ACNKHL_21325 [Shigella flexneri]